jgi:hypothetical protein
MSPRSKLPARRPVPVALCLMGLTFIVALVCTATSHAADYRMVLCAANNGSNSFTTSTNTASAQNPGGIFNFENYCGPAPFPAGDQALLRIQENQPSGNAGQGAYGDIYYDTPPFVHFREAGGFTRQPGTFNEGWRERFWIAGGSAGTVELLSQGQGAPQGITSTFAPHLWPFGGYLDFTRFVFELECVRPAGCDRSGGNAADANTFVFTLADESPSQVSLTNGGGPIMEGHWVRGAQSATYQFTELGSGIRMERIRIDGGERFAIDHSGECSVDSNGAIGVFARAFQPCAVAANPIGRSYAFDTASLADGGHTLQACAQDFAQWQGYNHSGSESCDQRTIYTDNTPPGAPAGLTVTSANPNRYLEHFGAQFALPPNQGSPITKVHYQVINAAGEVVRPEQVFAATNPTGLTDLEGPAKAGDYQLKVWLEDQVGFTGPASLAPIPRDTVPPAAPQGLAVTSPNTPRSAEGFDLRWRNIVDAGAPIDAAHYEVLDSAGKVVVPATAVSGENVQAIGDLDAPSAAGSYQLRLWLSDAEGNVGAPVTAPLAYDCLRSVVAGGQELTATLDGHPELTLQQGQGTVLTGSLRGQSGPVVAAPVCVFSRVENNTGRDFLGMALTDQDGGYRFPIPAGPSREVIAIHRPDQRQLRASATLRTVVHPTLRARNLLVHTGESGYFEGEIPGPSNDNVTIVLQVRSGKGWLAFRRYRTRNDGHYELSYPFLRTSRPTNYEMRAQVREAGGYPYLQGDSDPLVLRVVPGDAEPRIAKKVADKRRCAKVRRRGHRHSQKSCHPKRHHNNHTSAGR